MKRSGNAIQLEENSKRTVEDGESDGKTNRLGTCEVCAATVARYSCPKCEVKTCSVRCVHIHKKELNCDGIRDRTKFIPLRQMTNMDFMSDYYFLEECTRYAEDRKGDRLKRYTRYDKVLPTHLFRLRNAAAERGTKLRILVQHFTRHKENTTYYDWKLRRIYWRVEWVFVNACGRRYVDERCAEEEPLHRLLDKYVNGACALQSEEAEKVPQRQALQYYQSVGVFGLKILLKAEGCKRSGSRFHILDAAKTLKENLAGKTLVEFPCIYVSYESNPEGFEVIDSDEDIEAETKAHETNLETLRREQLAQEAAKAQETAEHDEDAEATLASSSGDKQQRRKERQRKREELASGNLLFTNEALWDELSSSGSDAGNETAEEEAA